jgi:hypothetical protein
MVLGKGSNSGGFFADDQTGDLITYCTKTWKIEGTWSASLLNGTGFGSLHHPNVKVYSPPAELFVLRRLYFWVAVLPIQMIVRVIKVCFGL